MKFIFITLFPEQIEAAGRHSMIKRGLDAGLLEMECINPRDFSTDKHRSVDDTPFGGGVGMVLKPGPMVEAIRLAKQKLPDAPVITGTSKEVFDYYGMNAEGIAKKVREALG